MVLGYNYDFIIFSLKKEHLVLFFDELFFLYVSLNREDKYLH